MSKKETGKFPWGIYRFLIHFSFSFVMYYQVETEIGKIILICDII